MLLPFRLCFDSATVGETSSVAHLLGEIAPARHKHPPSGDEISLVGKAKRQRVRDEHQ